MKSLNLYIAIIIAILFSSCSSFTEVLPRHKFESGFLDYSKYSSEGFFITESNTVPFNYVPIGSLSVSEHSGTVYETLKVRTKDGTKLYEVDEENPSIKRRVTKPYRKEISIESALEAFVNKARTVGANGVINLRFHYGDDQIIISGMIINR
jgi:hypothetical protein